LTASFARRYQKSTYLDSYDYLQAFALFQLEQYRQALELARQVSSDEYPAVGGGMKKSSEVNTAIHMAGKILHASGDLKKALEEYKRVKESFGDAIKSIEFLTEKNMTMDEVSIFKTGKSASITLRHKNLENVVLKVYKVDLMTFYLSEQDLERMTRINLAGISPVIHRSLNLEKAKPFAWNEDKIDLALDETGAYLVVAESDGTVSSGMVLKSELEIEVREDAEQGIVRVNSYIGSSNQFAKGVKVQVRGNHNDTFISGETDLRGIFSASGIKGVVTVLAQVGEQYGFYRGSQSIGLVEDEKGRRSQRKSSTPKKENLSIMGLDALGNNQLRLRQVQEEQNARWNIQTDVSNFSKISQKAKSLY